VNEEKLAMPPTYVTHEQARRIYDRIGRWQDTRPVSERRAMRRLADLCRFEQARDVVEFGCGTGRFAARLLRTRLSAEARYVGFDVSPTMLDLAREALAPWAPRARVLLSDGAVSLPFDDGAFDRFVSTYVVDLLSPDDIALLLAEAHRVLRPGGALGLASLTSGLTPSSRILTSLWQRLWSVRPWLVGGCRPVRLAELLPTGRWTVQHHETVTRHALASEVLMAERSGE
jgi:ubiquinone/menaquinone biosynthesis C-methylase UbiE